MSEFEFQQASRENSAVTCGIIGQSGTGKTYSALLLARGLVGPDGRVGIIDTEGRRALVYADDPKIGGFLHMDFKAPYSSERYRAALKAAGEKLDAVVIDSTSHEWFAEGGVLDYADQEEQRLCKGNMDQAYKFAMMKWVKPKMAHRNFLNYALSIPAHVIFCYREEVVTDPNNKGPGGKLEETTKTVTGKRDKFEMLFSVRLDPEFPGKVIEFEKALPEPMKGLIKEGDIISVETGQKLAGHSSSFQAAPAPAEDQDYAELRDQVMEWLADEHISDDQLNAVLKHQKSFVGETWQQASAKALDFILKNPETIKEKIAKL